MGAFFTNAICFKEDSETIEKYVKDQKRKAFLLTQEIDDQYIVLAEERCESQEPRENNQFFRPLSKLTKHPLLACMVMDSDDLALCLFLEGKDAYQFMCIRSEYELFKFEKLESLVDTYDCDLKNLSELHTKKRAAKHAFAEDYQKEIYAAIGVPTWSVGFGYTYLTEDEGLIEGLNKEGISVRKIGVAN